jgi:hypothetical protein
MRKKIQRPHLMAVYNTDPRMQQFVRYIWALSLVPVEDITKVWTDLKGNLTISARTEGVLASCPRKIESLCPPIDTSINFSTHVCKVTFKHLPQPLRSHISFGSLGQRFKISYGWVHIVCRIFEHLRQVIYVRYDLKREASCKLHMTHYAVCIIFALLKADNQAEAARH